MSDSCKRPKSGAYGFRRIIALRIPFGADQVRSVEHVSDPLRDRRLQTAVKARYLVLMAKDMAAPGLDHQRVTARAGRSDDLRQEASKGVRRRIRRVVRMLLVDRIG